jgi:hypothetical protein
MQHDTGNQPVFFQHLTNGQLLAYRQIMKEVEPNRISRSRLIEMTGLSAGAALLARFPLFADQPQSSKTKPPDLPTIKPGMSTSFGSLKQIDAGVLDVGYAEAGPADGPAVILLHGWPYDIHSFVDVDGY